MARQDPILFRPRIGSGSVSFWGRVKGAGRASQRHAWIEVLNKRNEPSGRYTTVCGVIPDECQPVDAKYRSEKRMVRVCRKCDVLVLDMPRNTVQVNLASAPIEAPSTLLPTP